MRSPTSLTRSGYGRWPVVHQFLEVSSRAKLCDDAYSAGQRGVELGVAPCASRAHPWVNFMHNTACSRRSIGVQRPAGTR